ncbi:hypothetical protein OIO90_005961 [Microbotryomycetes sp. JL221]|nr:hypothetical protein OIO90_005961 [Microbotryomycetes sp. JL221]
MIARTTFAPLIRQHANRSTTRTIPCRSFHSARTQWQHHLDATPQQFNETISSSKLVVVDFYADWCGPCRFLTPILKKVINVDHDKVDLMTINTDDQQELALKYKIRALPTVVAFKEGQAVGQFVGAKNEQDVRQFVDNLIA